MRQSIFLATQSLAEGALACPARHQLPMQRIDGLRISQPPAYKVTIREGPVAVRSCPWQARRPVGAVCMLPDEATQCIPPLPFCLDTRSCYPVAGQLQAKSGETYRSKIFSASLPELAIMVALEPEAAAGSVRRGGPATQEAPVAVAPPVGTQRLAADAAGLVLAPNCLCCGLQVQSRLSW